MKEIGASETRAGTRVFGCCCSLAAAFLFFLMSTATPSRALTNLCLTGSPNGAKDPGEQCDDGNLNNIDDCTNSCTISICGDAVLHTQHSSPTVPGAGALEQCDNGLSHCSGGLDNGQICSSNADCRGTCSGGQNPNFPCTLANASTNCGPGGTCNMAGIKCDDAGNNNDPGASLFNFTVCRTNCLLQRCGDGITDPGEQCDDGNTINGDGCDNNCTPSTVGGQPNCGNGVVDPGEDCDWGDNVKAPCAGPLDGANKECNGNNTGCTASCKFATCGDGFGCSDVIGCTAANTGGHLSHTEQCDNFGADSATCNGSAAASKGVDCMTSACGDKYINAKASETCDDGNTVSGDGCTGTDAHPGLNSCVLETCGDGIVNENPNPNMPKEECDWGKVGGVNGCNGPGGACIDNSKGCTASCLWAKCGDKNVCGDGNTCNAANTNGNLTGPEDCDGGYVAGDNSHVCLSSCKNASCGDNFKCSDVATCKLEVIKTGHSITGADCSIAPYCKGPEACDDGNTNETDTCTSSCQSPQCGDGIIEPNEQCDSGTALCTAGPDAGLPCVVAANCHGVCSGNGAPCTLANAATVCGDATKCNNPAPGSCGSGNRDDVAGACRHTCTKASCGDATVDGPENCDSGKVDTNGPCVITVSGGPANTTPGKTENCAYASCGDGLICNEAGCTTGPGCVGGTVADGTSCTKNADCGAGGTCTNKKGPEVCDNGSANSNSKPDACRTNCAKATCGDGVTDSGEGCDWGDATNPFITCTGPGGKCNSDTVAGSCRTTCQKASCGDGVPDPGEQCDTGKVSTTGTCIITKLGAPNLDPLKGPLNCATATCGDGFQCTDSGCTTGPGGGPEDCDTGSAVLGCDKGGTQPAGSACDVDANCGPGGLCVWIDPPGNCSMSPGVCNGGSNPGQPCKENADCFNGGACIANAHRCGTINCGNNIIDPGEECDDGNTLAGDGCDQNCQKEVCGNGIKQTLNCPGGKCEQCDFGAGPTDCTGPNGACNTDKAGCNGNCQTEVCGDGIVNDNPDPKKPKEQCDWGDGKHGACTGPNATCNSDTVAGACRTTCQNASCGDKVTDPAENCDTGGVDTGPEGNTGCNGKTCTFPSCGDGYLNTAAGEECDQGTGKCNAVSTNPGTNCTLDADCHGTGALCVGNSKNPDACRPTCVKPKCGDGILDGASGEGCEPPGTATCTASCCQASSTSWKNGFAGGLCQLNMAMTKCSFTTCKSKSVARSYGQRLATWKKNLTRAQTAALAGNTFQAEGTVHGIQTQAASVIKQVQRQCPQAVVDCVTAQLQDQLANNVLTKLHGTLALDTP